VLWLENSLSDLAPDETRCYYIQEGMALITHLFKLLSAFLMLGVVFGGHPENRSAFSRATMSDGSYVL
jgi:hypothetical protein